ncbi:GNAT family N-acetyltransferase [Bacteroides sp.]
MEAKTQSSDINISINKLLRENLKQVLSFSCGCEELDHFFHEELLLCAKHHYVSAYCAKNVKNDDIVAIFTLSNDSVVIDNVDKDDFIQESKLKISDEYTSTFEKQSSFPAINIGHLGVRSDLQSQGIGEQILDFVLYTFSYFSISGCQFITVDSLNNNRTNKFYARNGFLNQTNNDSKNSTRRMYLPIKLFDCVED